jgi:hypothetical protein
MGMIPCHYLYTSRWIHVTRFHLSVLGPYDSDYCVRRPLPPVTGAIWLRVLRPPATVARLRKRGWAHPKKGMVPCQKDNLWHVSDLRGQIIIRWCSFLTSSRRCVTHRRKERYGDSIYKWPSTQIKDVLCNPRNLVNPDSKLCTREIFHQCHFL